MVLSVRSIPLLKGETVHRIIREARANHRFFIVSTFLLFVFSACSTGFRNEGTAVYYQTWDEAHGKRKFKLEADPRTFKVLEPDRYAKDARSVFFQTQLMPEADAQTFEVLEGNFARDKNSGWYRGNRIETSRGTSLKVLGRGFSTDGHDCFFMNYPLKMVAPENFRFVYDRKGENYDWVTDGKHYFYHNYKVPSDDYDNLKIYPESGGITHDRFHAYYLDRNLNYDLDGNLLTDTIDIATFQVTGYLECSDKFGTINVFRGRIGK